MAVLVAALDSMHGVEEPHGVPCSAPRKIDRRSLAYFMRRHAEMLKNHQSRGAGFTRFVSLGGYPFNVARDGRIVGVMPIDALAWTETISGVLRDMRGRRAQILRHRAGRTCASPARPRRGPRASSRRWAGGWWKTLDFEFSRQLPGISRLCYTPDDAAGRRGPI